VGQVPVFIFPRAGWPSYTPRHWVPFTSPPTTRGATVEVFEHASKRDTDCIALIVFLITSLHGTNRKRRFQQYSVVVGVFTDPLPRNGLHYPIVLLLRMHMLRALSSNGHCLQSRRLATRLYATVCNYIIIILIIISARSKCI
jgi:hypothetical protein